MSSFTPIPLDEAKPEQLRDFALKFLNLDLERNATDAEVRSAIEMAQPGVNTIFVEQDTAPDIERIEPPEGDAVDRLSGSFGRNDPRAVIRILEVETEDGTGGHDVPVGVNGRVWQLKRGVDLPVPWRVVEALGLTIQDIVRHSEDGEVIVRQSARVPITVVQRPSEEAIAAWHAETDAQFCP